MATSKRSMLEHQLVMIYERAQQVAGQLEKLESLPVEPKSPFEDGTQVVFFQLKFKTNAIWYNYVAVKAKGLWYTSAKTAYSAGRPTSQLTWDDLIDWITSQEGYRLYLVDGMSLVVDSEED